MTIRTDAPVAEIAALHPHALDVFDRFRIDYCCGGRRPLSRACDVAGVSVEAVVGALLGESAAGPGTDSPETIGASLVALIDHIVETHHTFTRDALARLDPLLGRIRDAHVSRHPELARVHELFQALRSDLEPHLMKEEIVLFPFVRGAEDARLRGEPGPEPPCGSVVHPIDAMIAEHEQAGDILSEMRAVANQYEVPEDGCASYRRVYEGLLDLERDLHRHIHLENNVLFPRVIGEIA